MVMQLEKTRLLGLVALATACGWAVVVRPVELRITRLSSEQARLDAELERKRPAAAEFDRARREKVRLEQVLGNLTTCYPCHENTDETIRQLNETGKKIGGRFTSMEVLPVSREAFVTRISVAGDFVGTFAQVRALIGRLEAQRWDEFSVPRLDAIPGDSLHLTARIVATHFRYVAYPPAVPTQGLPEPVPSASAR